MLRCTISGLIPLLMSGKYARYTEELYLAEEKQFRDIIRHKSYYMIRKLPSPIAERVLLPELPLLLSGQKKNGMWKVRDTERITYDILAALKHASLLDKLYFEGSLRYNPLEYIKNKHDFYLLLIKANVFQQTDDEDKSAITDLVTEIKKNQQENGSWDNTVIGTAINIENLLDMGIVKDDKSIKRGVEFLFSNLNNRLEGIHTNMPYGLIADNMFTTADRMKEFASAARLKPEWIPRRLCYRTLAIIPDTVCLTLLVRMGMENDKRVESALDNIYHLYNEYGGLCACNIKQPFLRP